MTSLIGHTALQAQLAEMLEAGVLPHALLLHGPQGVGKRLLATKLAYRLMTGGTGLEPDTTAPVYHQIVAGSCGDFHVLEPEKGSDGKLKKSIGIKQVRALLADLQRSTDNQRVVIVDALEQMTDEAANALLKTLEEPRPNLTFVLVCHQLGDTLPTIRSRCRLVPVHPLTEAETLKVLVAQGGDEAWVPLAHGSPGSVLGNDAKLLRETMAVLRPVVEGGTPAKAPSAAQAPWVPEALLMLLAQQPPTVAWAKAYADIQTLKRRTALNIPHTMLADAALAILRQV
ncbi:MAG: AAA family ATPase [Alphaproteobacteria bacterium]